MKRLLIASEGYQKKFLQYIQLTYSLLLGYQFYGSVVVLMVRIYSNSVYNEHVRIST